MKTTIKLFSLLLCLSLLSCEEKNMEGNYQVVEMNGNDVSKEGATINITNNDGWRIAGNNSCNTYSASITYDGSNNIEIGPAMATKMYCEEKKETERTFMTLLSQVKSYRFSKGQLVLMNKAGEEIIKADRTDDK